MHTDVKANCIMPLKSTTPCERSSFTNTVAIIPLADLYHEQVFEEFEDDQFDFHGYSLRKFTINIYLKYVVQRSPILY